MGEGGDTLAIQMHWIKLFDACDHKQKYKEKEIRHCAKTGYIHLQI